MKTPIAITALLLALLPASLPGCPCTGEDEDAVCELIETLTCMAYGCGYRPSYNPKPPCIPRLVCKQPSCIEVVGNSGFERATPGHVPGWGGDHHAASRFDDICEGIASLAIVHTTPEDDTTDTRSAQVYQVVDYQALVPAAARRAMRRVRAQAAFTIEIYGTVSEILDRQFGLRLDFYSGDPSTFPTDQDPETIPEQTDTYARLHSAEHIAFFEGDSTHWRPLALETAIPANTSFLVVLLEAYEDQVDDPRPGNEFIHLRRFDIAEVAIDGGNTPPLALEDRFAIVPGTPVTLNVLQNDEDADSYLDPSSLVLTRLPGQGTAKVLPDGTVEYKPDATFSDLDTFTYTVADEEGLVSNEAKVIIEEEPVPNRPPVANQDTVSTPENIAIVIDVLANDTDPDGDSLTVSFVGPALFGETEIIDDGLAVRYTPHRDSVGTDAFGYLAADDEGATSFEGQVLVEVVADVNNPPEVTDRIDDFSVNVDPPGACSFDLDDHFADPDGDTLFYGFTVSNNAVRVSIDGSRITVRGSSLGQTRVTVIAQDTGTLRVMDTFEVDGALATDCGGNRAAR